jgi:hypothetical protein
MNIGNNMYIYCAECSDCAPQEVEPLSGSLANIQNAHGQIMVLIIVGRRNEHNNSTWMARVSETRSHVNRQNIGYTFKRSRNRVTIQAVAKSGGHLNDREIM